MDSNRLIFLSVIMTFVGLTIWIRIRTVTTARRRRKASAPVRSHTNYNLDVRRFRLEALRSLKWVAWLLGGVAICLIPAFYGHAAIATGLIICWTLLLISLSGTAMVNGSVRGEFIKRHLLVKLPDGPPPRELTSKFAWTRLFGGVPAEHASHILYGAHDTARWWLFRYGFEYAAPRARRQFYQYGICAVSIDKPLPRLVIDGGDVYDFDQFIPKEDREAITLEGSFGRNYQMYVPKSRDSENRLLAMSVMTPDVMDIYERAFGSSVMIIEGSSVLIMTRRDLFSDGAYELFYDGLEDFVKKLVRQTTIRADVGKLLKA